VDEQDGDALNASSLEGPVLCFPYNATGTSGFDECVFRVQEGVRELRSKWSKDKGSSASAAPNTSVLLPGHPLDEDGAYVFYELS
jgi:hypothetical protein